MKRYGHLFEKICSMDNLRLAHKNARAGKSWYADVKMVSDNEEEYLTALRNMLLNKTYNTSEYTVFKRREGKKDRLIYKLPYYPDRICQWAHIQVIEPYFLKQLMSCTYSAIPGRGIHQAVKHIHAAIRKDPDGMKYCLKLDVSKYYPSIDHTVLKQKLRRLFKDPDLLWLLDEIIDSTPGNVGIPIGNYFSQYAGNFYLSSFDHWIKEVKRVKHYFRYMDDICIFADNKEDLHAIFEEVKVYMEQELHLTIKANWQIFPTFVRGLDFVGYRFFKEYTLLRKSTCQQFKRKMLNIAKKIRRHVEMSFTDWCSINSYRGWLIWCDGTRLAQKYIEPIQPYAVQYYNQHIKRKAGITV